MPIYVPNFFFLRRSRRNGDNVTIDSRQEVKKLMQKENEAIRDSVVDP